jgi:YD repeat-containing protein
MAWIAVAVGVGSVASAGIAAATRDKPPGAPDYAAANREGVMADIETLPIRRQVEAAARMGTQVLNTGFTVRDVSGSEGATAARTALDDARAALTGIPRTLTETTAGNGRGQGQVSRQVDNPAYTAAQDRVTAAQTAYQRAISEAPAGGSTVRQYFDPQGRPVSQTDAVRADFTGLGDIDAARQQLEFSRESADSTAQTTLYLQQRYGADFIRQRLEELKLSDPTGFALREQMGQSVTNELAQGSRLSPSMLAEVQQSTRAAQAARGNVMGDANAAVEGMESGNAGYRLFQQRLANASAFLSGTTPVAQFGQISGAQQGAAGVNPMAIQQFGSTVNPNAGAQGAQFAMQSYGQQSSNAFNSNAQNPWQSLLGGVVGMGTMAGGIALGNRLSPRTTGGIG